VLKTNVDLERAKLIQSTLAASNAKNDQEASVLSLKGGPP